MFDTGLELSGWLLSWLDADLRTALAVPLMIVLLLFALSMIVRLLPVIDRLLAPLGTGLAMLLGMLMLLPEYLCTVALRRQNRPPPGIFHTYGDGVVGLVHLGTRVSRAGLAGFTRDGGVRRALILLALVLIVAVGNANSCPPETSSCMSPLTTWWNQTKTLIAGEGAAAGDTVNDEEPSRKPTPTKAG